MMTSLSKLTFVLAPLGSVALLLAGWLYPQALGIFAILAFLLFAAGILVALWTNFHLYRWLRVMNRQIERIRAFNFEPAAALATHDELGDLSRSIEAMKNEYGKLLNDTSRASQRSERLLAEMIPIGVDLMTEKDFNGLLERMLRLAQTFSGADGGTLYMKTEDNHLRFEIIHTDSLKVNLGGISSQPIAFPPLPMVDPETGEPNFHYLATYVANTGETYNFPGATNEGRFHEQVRQSVLYDSYRIHSMLTIPLKNINQQVLGVLQLINAQDPETRAVIHFDPYIQRWMESFSFLAVAALEAYIREQHLKNEIDHLRFEIDEARRERQVEEIIESDYFKRISALAEEMRHRRPGLDES